MAGDDGSDGAESALAVTREEARATLERQVATLDDIDTKAAKLLRLNVVIVGALVTVVSVTADADMGVSLLYNGYTIFGSLALLASTVVAALTYTVSDVRIGLSADDVRAVLAAEPSEDELRESLVRGYADWIAVNYRVNAINTPLITSTLLLLMYALTAFVVGTIAALAPGLSRFAAVTAAVALIGVTAATRIHGQLVTWWRIR